jgi:hypothetical protein
MPKRIDRFLSWQFVTTQAALLLNNYDHSILNVLAMKAFRLKILS